VGEWRAAGGIWLHDNPNTGTSGFGLLDSDDDGYLGFYSSVGNHLVFEGQTAPGIASFTASQVFKGGTSTTFNISSDLRLKTNINNYTKGLDDIVSLRPVNYTKDGFTGVGLIAQEILQTNLSTMVDTDKEGYYSVNNHELFYALINSVKELKQEIDNLKAELRSKE
jgi:hypothetical protein